ncbi:type 1 glutamine amidotransferase [Agriterribacter sp.]|uniref:type 1 glutamine amidotransferase n=1 Tax=Agriterribacter sp. TaxID=2821509 RepID=UPI002BA7EFBB|nr:type 1 glutamine amidotransferase [Agriterribacter sp.]HRO46109.1 type 1 glutamine amidotransferase [Agriterribacter sp.]HRQ16169.1 type 1 glutamine amidotransferase [Agriterribacter sp.]
MNIHFIQHEVFEAPGAYLKWAEQKGYQITFSKVYEFQPLPDAAAHIDLLIILGGPQSPDTSVLQCPHFNAEAEMNLIRKCIQAKKAIVGVCLGSQLIGQSLNAPYAHSPEKEIGNFSIALTEAGKQDENISHFGPVLTVGHWHNDMPGLTDDCEILAISEGCPRQIIKYADYVYGFQCHMELTKEVVALLIENEDDLKEKSRKHTFVQSPEKMLGYDYGEMNNKLFVFLDKLVAAFQPILNTRQR